MKSSRELQLMLCSAICDNFYHIQEEPILDCYNEILGNTSFLLSGILERELEDDTNWSSLNWIDDSLIHKVKVISKKVQLWGIIIWGRDGTSKQWTDPFYCEFLIDCKHKKLQKLIFLFGDETLNEITYEDFALNRTYWDKSYYSNSEWSPSERNWKFIIHVKN